MIRSHYIGLFASSITSYGINKAPKYARSNRNRSCTFAYVYRVY